jgi:hypothetical protein
MLYHLLRVVLHGNGLGVRLGVRIYVCGYRGMVIDITEEVTGMDSDMDFCGSVTCIAHERTGHDCSYRVNLTCDGK